MQRTRKPLVVLLITCLTAALVSLVSVDRVAGAEPRANPFGIMLGSTPPSIEGLVETASVLRANFVRFRIAVPDWDLGCPRCEAYREAGFDLVLTVRTAGGEEPSSPPADEAGYISALSEILEVAPTTLVVENEPEVENFWNGTPEEYGELLDLACSVSHSSDVPCTNGGLAFPTIRAMVYMDHVEQGRPEEAQSFAYRTAVSIPDYEMFTSPSARDVVAERAQKGEDLLDIIASTDADLLNFHWFVNGEDSLTEAVDYLRSRVDLPLMSNEVKVHSEHHRQQIIGTMEEILRSRMEAGIFYSIDTDPPGDTQDARALHNEDGTLRPTGLAFTEFVKERIDKQVDRKVTINKDIEWQDGQKLVRFKGRIARDPECAPDQTVRLQRKFPEATGEKLRRFKKIAEKSTNEEGRYRFTAGVKAFTKFRVVAPASGACGRSVSRVLKVWP